MRPFLVLIIGCAIGFGFGMMTAGQHLTVALF